MTPRRAFEDAVWDSSLRPTERLVALCFARHASRGTELVWVTRARLQSLTGLSRNGVDRALAGLRASGWLVVVEQARQHRSTRYQLTVPNSIQTPPTETAESAPAAPDRGVWNGTSGPPQRSLDAPRRLSEDTSVLKTGTPRLPSQRREPLQEPLPNPSRGRGASAPDAATGGGRITTTHPHHPNAERALLTLRRQRNLPLEIPELIADAYRLGGGDPWTGYLEIKTRTEQGLDGARDPLKVLRSRLAAGADR